jgi:hypothetical protein
MSAESAMVSLNPLSALRLWQRLPDIDTRAMLPVLTVVLLLLNGPEIWYLRIPLILASVIGLTWQPLLCTSAYWYVVATLLGATVFFNWDTADNHQYLFVYWTLALCSAFSLPLLEQHEALARASRWLLALCMLLAAAWKLATPTYMDGTFFEFTLVADARFADLARAIGGMPSMGLADNRELTGLVTDGYLRGIDVNAARLMATPRVEMLAQALTWWTAAIEGLIGVLFLLPDGKLPSRLRNFALVLFAATTYTVAHVRGFGWMLMLLGIAQCNPGEKAWRWSYLGAFLLIQLYFLPVVAIAELALDALGFDAGCGCFR